jgi:pimeloyl-ACP methyl ester carboxylesterase
MRIQLSTVPPALSGTRKELITKVGALAYYSAGPAEGTGSGEAPPLLLIHSVNAAGSAFEMRPVYDHYRNHRTVYALDLPGFGFSNRNDSIYTPRIMTDAVVAMVDEIRRVHGPGPIDAMGLSLGSEFLARAASEFPEAFRSLALISPTGFDGPSPRNGAPGSTRGVPLLRTIFTFPLWSRKVFELLTTRPSIRFFLEKSWGRKEIDESVLDYSYATTRHPGAHHAPYYFLAGFLFSNDIQAIYESLKLPVWMVHGVRGDFVDYQQKQRVANKPNWKITVYSTGALPHFEIIDEFTQGYDQFLQSVASAEASAPGAAAAA